ncbi:MAG: DUF2156 domain-containing protein [Bacteroidetes bacterium]|nr:DUF2156 domain-containing protein [Bacteroidota bacterium]
MSIKQNINKTNAKSPNTHLPDFPKFEHLTIDHRTVLEDITNKFDSYSDFNFISLYSWDTQNEIEVSSLNNNLIIKFTDYSSPDIFFSFIGTNKIEETAKILIQHSIDAGHQPYLSLVPEAVASKLLDGNTDLIVKEDRDNHDYILSVETLTRFSSNQFRGKKNLYNRFHKLHGNSQISKELDLNNSEIRSSIIEVLDDWSESRNKNDEDTRNEFIAIKKCLNNQKFLNIKAFGVYVEDKLIAFTLFEMRNNREAIIHFDKANINYVGIFENLKHGFAKLLNDQNVATINYEQDLGITGLRRAKESYHPIKFLKKYTIKLP